MKRALFVAALLLPGCGFQIAWTSPEYRIQVWDVPAMPDYFTPEQLDAQAGQVAEGLASLERGGIRFQRDELKRALAESGVWVTEGPVVPCFAPKGQTCAGIVLGMTMKVQAKPCPWRTAYRHELTHYLLLWFTGDYDYRHSLEDVWAVQAQALGDCEHEGAAQ